MSTYKKYKQQLENATTEKEILLAFQLIEQKFFDIDNKSNIEVMTNEEYYKWNDLYDVACEKYLSEK